MKQFSDLALSPAISKAIDSLGFTKPTEIQEKSIPLLLGSENVDFHGQAQTGTGKTLAFGLPLLEKINTSSKFPQALIVAPTRELVCQICESLQSVAKFTDVVVEPVYGGVSIVNQIRTLKRGVHVVVGTPGRLRDHLRRKTLSLKNLKTFVLDEADIMLDMGFKEEIDEILQYAPQDRQIWLFSATVKGGINDIKKSHMSNPVSVRVSGSKVTTSNTQQFYCTVPSRYRLQALCRIVDTSPEFYGLIFCQTKMLTGETADRLVKRGYRVGCLHGDMDQKMRNKVIKKFKDKSYDIVVATDVAARGIDVADLTHVINYTIPEDQESYVHRIGRTGRAGKKGVAITFVNGREVRMMQQLSRRFKTEINQLEIPSVDAMFRIRLEKAIGYFKDSAEKKSMVAEKFSQLHEAVSAQDKDQLVSTVVHMLTDKYLRGHEQEKDIPSVCPREKSLQDGKTRELVLHLGREDGIDRDSVLQYCLDANAIDQNEIERVRVIKRRSFVILGTESANKLVKALKGKKLQGRKVRVSIASTEDSRRGRSDFGSRGRRFGGRDRDRGSRGFGRSGRGNGGGSRSGNGGGSRGRRRSNAW